MCVYALPHKYVCVCVCMYMNMCVCIGTHVCIRACMCVPCVHICVCVRVIMRMCVRVLTLMTVCASEAFLALAAELAPGLAPAAASGPAHVGRDVTLPTRRAVGRHGNRAAIDHWGGELVQKAEPSTWMEVVGV